MVWSCFEDEEENPMKEGGDVHHFGRKKTITDQERDRLIPPVHFTHATNFNFK